MEMNNIKNYLDNLDMNNTSKEQLNKIINSLSGKEIEAEISKRQQKIEEANTIRIQSETKIASYKESYEEILKELKSIGVNPKNINEELLNLCKEIVDITVEMDKCMPDIDAIKKLQQGNNTQKTDVGF